MKFFKLIYTTMLKFYKYNMKITKLRSTQTRMYAFFPPKIYTPGWCSQLKVGLRILAILGEMLLLINRYFRITLPIEWQRCSQRGCSWHYPANQPSCSLGSLLTGAVEGTLAIILEIILRTFGTFRLRCRLQLHMCCHGAFDTILRILN